VRPIIRTFRETIIAYKTLIVHVDDSERCVRRVEVASRIARDFAARLVGVYLVPTPALTPSVSALLPVGVVSQRLQESGEAQQRAAARFRETVAAAGLAAMEWRAPAGDPMRAIVAHARGADLAIIGQPDTAEIDALFAGDIANAVVMEGGRPVLAVPYIGVTGPVGVIALVALDHSRESARAVADALPLLVKARKVIVLTIDATGEEAFDDIQARTQVVAFLRGHGIAAEERHLDLPDVAVGELLLSQAADFGADLIVMGAYSHPRLRELVLGGVTRTMLKAMTVPVLMSR
jgi:nucleotide-binding universal stress UspA family protein